jgi:hypothetical protein
MRLPRFRLRALMLVIAVVVLLIGGVAELPRRRERFQRYASYHTWESIPSGPGYPESLDEAARRGRSEWQAALAKKYRRAARHPWLPVWPDPPEPE